jgi:formylmethanofuran dehydrogenase subunit E
MLETDQLDNLDELLRRTNAMHSHACPRQVLGVRAGILASRLFGLVLPQKEKRLFAFVETDGCFADGVSVATGCNLGRRTMRLVDYGKVAVTFVDTVSGKAVRVYPNPSARDRSWKYAPGAPDNWHAQLEAYQTMPTCELLLFEQVDLLISMEDLISKPGLRAVCSLCGEEIMNEREVSDSSAGPVLCRHCAGIDIYYRASDR